MTISQHPESIRYENARLFARHTFNFTEAEADAYAAGHEDYRLRFRHKGEQYGALEHAYRAGWDDRKQAEEDPA